MRTRVALAIYVSLLGSIVGTARAGDWKSDRVHASEALTLNNFADAIVALQASLQSADSSAETAESNYELGLAYHFSGHEKEAVKPLEAAVSAFRTDVPDLIRAVRATDFLSAVRRNLGDYSGAEKLLRDALAWAPAGDSRATLLCGLGDLLREEGRGREAMGLLQKVVAEKNVLWPRQFDALIGMASLHRDARLWDLAYPEWTRAAEIARANKEPTLEAIATRGMGETWIAQGEPARGEPLLKRALSIFEQSPAADLQVASTLGDLGQLYLSRNRLAMAEDVLGRAIGLEEKALSDRHPQLAVLFQMMADSLARRGDLVAAQVYMDRARTIVVSRFGEDSTMAAAVTASWGMMIQRAKRNAEAILAFQSALAIFDKAGDDLVPLKVQVLNSYAEALKATNRKQEANALMAQARSFQAK